MKKLILAVTMMAALNVNAADCDNIAVYARDVMTQRQNNTSMSSVYNNASESGKIIVKRAYKESLFRTDKYKARAINSFENKIFMECLDE